MIQPAEVIEYPNYEKNGSRVEKANKSKFMNTISKETKKAADKFIKRIENGILRLRKG